MNKTTRVETTKVWCIPEISDLVLLRAKYVTQSFSRHTHQRYAIGVIENGALGFYYRGESLVASQGNINLCIPGEAHTGYSASESGWAYRMFYVDPKLFQQVASDVSDCYSPLPYFQSGVIQDNDLAQCLRQLHIKLELQVTPLLEQESLLIWTLSQMVLRYADDSVELKSCCKEHQSVKWVREYIEAHYAEDISIEDLKSIACLSPFHLIRVFHKEVGIPPHSYLRQVRVERSKELLIQGHSIAQVALETGFYDQSHLTRQFKRIVGVTPGHYSNLVQ